MSLRHGKTKHSITSSYKKAGKNAAEVSTNFDIDGYRPLTLTSEHNLDWDDLKLATTGRYGKVRNVDINEKKKLM